MRASFILISFLVLCFLCPYTAHGDAASNGSPNDATVDRLRGALAARGIYHPPDPPKALGVHTACIRYGRSCPDSYVEFLEDELVAAGGPRLTQQEEAASKAKSKAKRAGERPPVDTDAETDSKIRGIRHLRNVLRDRLAEHTSPEAMAHCREVRWMQSGLRLALAVHDGVVLQYWSLVTCRLLPCAVVTALLVWVFLGDRIPRKHLHCLITCDPTFLVNEVRTKRPRSTSVAELVMERESFNMSGSGAVGDLLAASVASTHDLEKEAYRRNRWALMRFALLETYNKLRPAVVVLKLRVLLSSAVFIMLLWTLIALPLHASDLKGERRGLFQQVIGLLFPSWVSTSALLYFGWSWIGSMVAYAGWEVLAAVDALLHSEDRAAGVHEQILQKWDE